MAGYVPDSVKPRYYGSADIFCAPATGAESFGIVLLEAMASGLPVVATEVPGYMSVLEPGHDSLTVRPKGWAELGAALIILARDAELRARMGAYGHEKARRYAWDAVAPQVIEVYEEARDAARQTGERHVHNAV
jgi:phosphatidylinositol alpha-mannosyltransferase